MNQLELNEVMREIDAIINQLSECHFCKKGIDEEARKLLSDLFRLKLEQACRLKKAS